jgi:uncharacterized protein (TIGR01777 family)
MRIVLAGATGFIGRALVAELQGAGHDLVVLTRTPAAAGLGPGVSLAAWDARTPSGALTGALEGAGAVVNLAGANIGAQRWTAARKQELQASRQAATGAIVSALGALPPAARPGVLVNASGIDYYGDRGDEVVTEASPPGGSFLARLCVEWEAAARKAEALGVRVVTVRTGLVLGRKAEALQRLALPFKLFVGGPLGNGKQWFSWIHLDDIVGLYRLGVENGDATGAINGVAPGVRREADVAREVGRILGRPSWAPVPAVVLKLVLGEQADLVLHGRRAEPTKALALGYQYKYPDLPAALAQALGG